MTVPLQLAAPRSAMPGHGLSRRIMTWCGYWSAGSTTPLERWVAGRGRPTVRGDDAFQPQCGGQRFPGVLRGSRGHRIPLHDRRALTTEVREVQPKDAEKTRPAEFGALELVVPVIGAGEEAMYHANDTDTPSACFDAPLGGHRRHVRRPARGFGREPPGRVPTGHGRRRFHSWAEVAFDSDGLAVLFHDLGRHEPGRNTRPGGDGLPDFLRCAGDLDFDLDGTASAAFFLHAHDGS